MTIQEFLAWGAQYRGFPYGSISYWVEAAARDDGKDMYDMPLVKSR